MANRFTSPFADVGSGITPEDGAKLFFFDTGTANARNTFSDKAETTPNSNPVIANQSGVFADIFMAGTYKVRLTDKNDVQIWEADPVEGVSINAIDSFDTPSLAALEVLLIGQTIQTLGRLTAGDGGAGLYQVVADGTGADDGGAFINSNPSGAFQLKLITTRPNFKQWAAVGDDVADDTTPINNCVIANPQRDILANAGTYKTTDEILFPFSTHNSTRLSGEQRNATKIIITGATNKAAIRLSASSCTLEYLGIAGSGGSGNSAIRVSPEDETQTTLRVGQDRNVLQFIDISGTLAEGVVLKTGPDVGGGDSSCYFNILRKVRVEGTAINRGVYLTDGINAGSSPANRNLILECRFSGGINVGIHNEGADTTHIAHCNFEGISEFTTPLAIPTAIKIDQLAPVSAKDNAGVVISDCRFENNDRDIENANQRTEIYGSNHDTTLCLMTAEPQVILGGVDFSTTTQNLPGYRYQTNSQVPGLENSSPVFGNGVYLQTGQTRLDQYDEGLFTPVLLDNSNDTGEGQVYSKQVGRFTRIGNRCFFDIRIRTTDIGTLTGGDQAKVGGLPFPAKNVTDYNASVSCGLAQLITLGAVSTIVGRISANESEIRLGKFDSVNGTSNMTITEWTTTGDIAVSGSYEID